MWPMPRPLCLVLPGKPARKAPPRRRPASHRPMLEALEDRTLLSVFQVTTTVDNGDNANPVPGSLRDAINQVNAGLYDEIDFNLAWNDPGHVYYQGSLGNVQPVPAGTASDADLAGTAAPQWQPSWWRIQLQSALPTITSPVFINGRSQPGAKANDQANDDDAVLRVELNGRGPSPVNANGLTIAGGNSTVRGLVINGFLNHSAILLQGAGGDRVQGNFIGTDVSGTRAPYGLPNFGTFGVSTSDLHVGVEVDESYGFQHDSIGTDSGDFVTGLGERNVISAAAAGVAFYGPRWLGPDPFNSVGSPSQYPAAQTNNVVAGNFIGTDVHGTTALGNWVGVTWLLGAHDDLVGTNADGLNDAGERNIISGNQFGVAPGGGTTLASYRGTVAGNWIGTDVNGGPLGNLWGGVGESIGSQSDRIGGPLPGQGNTIAYNGHPSPSLANDIASHGTPLASAAGVWIPTFRSTPVDITVQGNSIYGNAGLGIDLGGSFAPPQPDGVTLNDSAGHTGPNRYQDFPVLSSAFAGPTPVVTGTLNLQGEGGLAASTTFTLDFYASPSADPTNYGQGQYYLGSARVSTDANGSISSSPDGSAVISTARNGTPVFTVPLGAGTLPDGTLPAGWVISATATDASGDTSEFSQDIPVTKDSTITGVVSSANPSLLNQAVVFTATVSPVAPGAGLPSGTVTFYYDVVGDPGHQIGQPKALSGGQATSDPVSSLPVGPHTIYAVYGGDGNFLDSQGQVVQAVHYQFGGFLPPLQPGQTYHLGSTRVIQWQLTDADGNFISSLGAVQSLQIQSVDAQGNPLAPPFNPAASGGTALRYDPTANQFIFNWDTKGLSAGYYEIELTLADGTVQTLVLQLQLP